MKFTNLLTGVSIVALTAALAVAPVGFGNSHAVFGVGAQTALAAGNGNGNGKGHDDDEVRGRDRADEMLAERDNRGRGNDDAVDNRGRGRADEVRAVVDNEGRGKVTVTTTAPGTGTTTGTVTAATDDGFRNHGEKVSLFVRIAHALGFGGNVGALQANFGTAPDGAGKPGNGPTDWAAVNLDVNKDGVVNQTDLTVATLLLPVITPPPTATPPPTTTPPVVTNPPPATPTDPATPPTTTPPPVATLPPPTTTDPAPTPPAPATPAG